MHVCMYAHTYACMHVSLGIYACKHMYAYVIYYMYIIYMSVCMQIYVIHTCTQTHIWSFVYLNCGRSLTRVDVHTYIYTYIDPHVNLIIHVHICTLHTNTCSMCERVSISVCNFLRTWLFDISTFVALRHFNISAFMQIYCKLACMHTIIFPRCVCVCIYTSTSTHAHTRDTYTY